MNAADFRRLYGGLGEQRLDRKVSGNRASMRYLHRRDVSACEA